ncbi:hypothetical protein ANO11243_010370 [Dothideomycetidae sp. 11243]|nr:hypothetical protein ANO11243_010370 [fungal sp. No.11243]
MLSLPSVVVAAASLLSAAVNGMALPSSAPSSPAAPLSASAADTASPPSATTLSKQNIWHPAPSTPWQIVLQNPLRLPASTTPVVPDVPIYNIDLFTNTPSTISRLRSHGKKVICYFSAGTYEPDRPDSHLFAKEDLGKGLPEWPGERWVRTGSPAIRKIMSDRIALAKQKGCDAVDPDNVDGYDNDNGLGLTRADAVSYVRFLAAEAHKHGMACSLKNAGGIIHDVLDVVQFAVVEQCVLYNECKIYQPFIRQGKAVLHIEYPPGLTFGGTGKDSEGEVKKFCNAKDTGGFSTVLKKMNLDGWVRYCDGTEANTPMDTS